MPDKRQKSYKNLKYSAIISWIAFPIYVFFMYRNQNQNLEAVTVLDYIIVTVIVLYAVISTIMAVNAKKRENSTDKKDK